jgi:N-acetylglucosamine-6-sulfatase
MAAALRRSSRASRARVRAVLAVVVAVTLLLVTACGSSSPRLDLPTGPYSKRPNIVFVLTDDLDTSLVQYMPHVLAMKRAGMSFSNYTVTDSECCPSRATIFTGEFPHDTGVFTNVPPDGGFGTFFKRGDGDKTFATALQAAGYRTAMMGKYLNGYPVGFNAYNYPADYIPPGWSEWDAISNGYGGYDYNMNRDRDLVTYGHSSDDYTNHVLTGLGQRYILSSAADRKPFFLEIASFSPHHPFVPAPRDRGTFTNLLAPEGPSFNVLPKHAPPWLADRAPLSAVRIAHLNTDYVRRVESVQSVDRMIGNLEATLKQAGQLKNTVFVFSSDNGYHLGQHGLGRGKLTAFDTDIKVPLVVTGPGVPAGTVNPDVTENVDLASTFEQLAGAAVPASVDGRSLVPLLHGEDPPWRTLALVEHHGPDTSPDDPDAQGFVAGNPPSYNAIRSANWTYVRYDTGAREYYYRPTDPAENDNIVGSLPPARVRQLDSELNGLVHCHGATSCWRAGRPRVIAAP